MGKIAKKRFGQHFLHDSGIIDRIVAAIHPKADDLMVEIGPGPGALTVPLIAHLDKLHAIEIDRDWAARLEGTVIINNPKAEGRLQLHNVDVLKYDFARLSQQTQSIRLVGNLPYNISTPILFHLIQYNHLIKDMVFMFQKEVAERICAQPGTSAYGRLSVMMQYYFQPQMVLHLPPGAFKPPPKVDSAVVRFTPIERENRVDIKLLKQVVTDAFNQRRKTLRNTLKKHLTSEDFETLQINPQLRAENLALQDYIRITEWLSQPDK